MRHPFANVQYYASSLSVDDLGPEETPIISTCPRPPQLAQTQRTAIAPRVETSTTDFIKRIHKASLHLGGLEEGTSVPVYHCGSTIEGTITMSEPFRILALDVTIMGRIRTREVAGAGAADTEILQESAYAWDSRKNAPLPMKPSFRYTLPATYLDQLSGESFPLPPTYQTHLSGIPRFTVQVSYQIIADIVYTERRAPLWRKRSCLRAPFTLRQLTRPSRAGPFRLSPSKSLAGPQTLFTFTIASRRSGHSPVETHVFLPSSQICSIKEPIPFFVTLFADEESLGPLTSYRPSPTSFHPLSSSSHSSLNSVQSPFSLRVGTSVSPLRVRLQRMTTVNILRAGVSTATADIHIFGTKVIGRGDIHSIRKGPNSITWAGTITVAADVGTGGFDAATMKVSDSIMVSIRPSDALRSRFTSLHETIPVRLTTESHGYFSAVPVGEV